MKKILILMSTYNGEKYLKEQLDSLLNQRDVELDILIRDDMSKDNTLEILSSYEHKYKNISIIKGENLGACRSFLELVNKCDTNYDFYAFCDQDDVWQDDKLITGINKLNNVDNNKSSLYFSGQILVDEKLNEIYNHKIDVNRSKYASFIFNQAAGCTIIFNNALLKYLKMYIPQNVYGHDVWCYKLCSAIGGNICIDTEGKILYRQHGNNVVGIDNGIKGKINRAKKYIYKYSPSSYAKEILNGYLGYIDSDWVEFLNTIIDSNHSLKSKIKLIKENKIKFNSLILKILFILKVFAKKM